MLNVNNDGTGLEMVCPKSSKIFQIFGLLPVAIKTFLDVKTPSVVSISNESDFFLMDFTEWFINTSTLCFLTSFKKQSTIVCEESVIGNMRPSSSIFKGTPRFSNQSMV